LAAEGDTLRFIVVRDFVILVLYFEKLKTQSIEIAKGSKGQSEVDPL